MSDRRDERRPALLPAEEELLAAVLAGDVAKGDPRLAALSAAARERLAELRSMQALLDRAGADERAAVSELDQPAAAEPRAAPRVADPVARRFWLRAAGLAALAAGLVLVLQSFQRDGGGDGHRGTLNAIEPVTLLEPKGEVEVFVLFRWEARDPQPFARYVLSIWDEAAHAADPKSAPLLEREVGATSFRLGAADPSLPDRIAWRVDVVPLDGARQRGPVEKAWRRR